MTREEELNTIKVVCAFLLWCGFLLLFSATGDFAGVVQGLSGFILTVLAIGGVIMSLIDKEDVEEDIVEVNREDISNLARYALLLDALHECGVEEWEQYDVANALYEEKLKKMKEMIEDNE